MSGLAGLGFLIVAAVQTGAAASAAGVHARALELYRQKRYAEACPLFEQVVAARPEDGAAWADLAVCEAQRGQREAAARDNVQAVRFGDAKTRQNAYYNLAKLEHAVSLPDQGCAVLPPTLGLDCELGAAVCIQSWTMMGTGGGESGAIAVFADSEDRAREARERLDESDPDASRSAADLDVDYRNETFCGYCTMHAWRCEESAAVRARARSCYEERSQSTLARDPCEHEGPECTAYEDCVEAACTDAEAAQSDPKAWPEVAREYAKAIESCAGCGVQEARRCRVVAVDGCRRRVGYVCTEERKGGKPKTSAGEIELAAGGGELSRGSLP